MKPAFLDQPDRWLRASRDSREICRQATAIRGPYRHRDSLGHRVVPWLSALILVGLIVYLLLEQAQ